MSAVFDLGSKTFGGRRADAISAEAASHYAEPTGFGGASDRPKAARGGGERGRSLSPALWALALIAPSALLAWRAPIVRAIPVTAPAYAAIGLPVNFVGLDLRGVRAQLLADGSRKALIIEGELVNPRREAVTAPPLSLTLRGADGRAKYVWTSPAPKPKLEAGETVAFRARLLSPPDGSADILVRFATEREAAARIASSERVRR